MPSEAFTVTVVVPCYMRAAWIRPTIDSILAQDWPHVECIVTDGGSTDGTVKILKSYGDRIRWVSEPDKGHSDAINKGWKMGTGQVLAWLNADDLWEVPGAAGTAARYLQAHPDTDVVYGDCGNVDSNGNPAGRAYIHDWDLEHAVMQCDHCIPQPAAFIRRSAAERAGMLDVDLFQKKDHFLWLKIALEGKIVRIPGLLGHARTIRGLSFDARTAAPACVEITRRFYSLPGVPATLASRRQRALSNAFLRGADYALAGGPAWRIVFYHVFRAVLTDRTNAGNALYRFAHMVDTGLPESSVLRIFARGAWRILKTCARLLSSWKKKTGS